MSKRFKSLLLLTAISVAVIQGGRADPITAKPPTTKDGQPYSVPTANTHPLRVVGATPICTPNSRSTPGCWGPG